MNNVDIFFKLYNDLDAALRNYYFEENRSHSVMMRYITDLEKTNIPKFINYAKKLDDIRIIRNNLVHELDMNVNQFISITDENINFLKMILDMVSKIKRAKDIMVPLKDIFLLKDGDKFDIPSVIHTMRNRGFSQLPVINDKNVLYGVFSPNVLFAYLNDHPNKKIKEISNLEIGEYIGVNDHFSESYIFVKENTSLTDLIQQYIDTNEENKRVAMAFVTKNGAANEPLLGIIVKKDILSNF